MRFMLLSALTFIYAIQSLATTNDSTRILEQPGKITILDQASESIDARIDIMAGAEHTIDAQYFSIKHDNVSVTSLALLKKAAQRGVKVRIIVDSLNNLMTREMMAAFLDNLSPSALSKVEIREFNQFSLLNPFCYTRRMHDKSLIVDGQYLIVGDRNIADGYYNRTDKKTFGLPLFEGIDAIVQSERAANVASEYFQARWDSAEVKPVRLYEMSRDRVQMTYCDLQTGEGADPGCYSRVATSISAIKKEMQRLDSALAEITRKREQDKARGKLFDWRKEAIETDYVEFIHDKVGEKKICEGKSEQNMGARLYQAIRENTKSDLMVITPYLVVTTEMENLIKELRSRGVQVRFVTNSKVSTDVQAAAAGYLKTRDKLLDLGVTIYEYEKLNNESNTIHSLHAKVVLMDSESAGINQKGNALAYVGSYNWDPRSQNINSEVGVLFSLGGKNVNPNIQLRKRLADILRTTTRITSQNVDYKSSIDTTSDVQNSQIRAMIEQRRAGLKTWSQLLEIKLFGIGKFLEGQL